MLMKNQLQAHDLLWGMSLERLDDTAPDWVKNIIDLGHPVVVRRALTDVDVVAVGIRGTARHERYAAEMLISDVTKQLKPEALHRVALDQFPHLRDSLNRIQLILNPLNLPWGYTGSVGYELATRIKTVTENSDIDLLIRTEDFMSKTDANRLLEKIEQTRLKMDVQLQTPQGGVALKEWARATGKVLLKRHQNAILVANPWY